jgi:hypothetical protein
VAQLLGHAFRALLCHRDDQAILVGRGDLACQVGLSDQVFLRCPVLLVLRDILLVLCLRHFRLVLAVQVGIRGHMEQHVLTVEHLGRVVHQCLAFHRFQAGHQFQVLLEDLVDPLSSRSIRPHSACWLQRKTRDHRDFQQQEMWVQPMWVRVRHQLHPNKRPHHQFPELFATPRRVVGGEFPD